MKMEIIMKINKFLGGVLSLSLLLSACGTSSSDSNSDVTELTFWGHQNVPWNDSYEKIAKEFESENPDIKINFEFFPYDQFESKVQTSLMSKEGGADIYEMWGGWAIDFASTDALAQIPDSLSEEVRNEMYPSTYGALEYDGKIYGMPMEFNIEYGGMIINNHIFEEKGVTAPTTWEELVDVAKKCTVKEGETFEIKGFDFVNWDSVPYTFLSMILSQGGSYLSEKTFDFNTPEAIQSWEALAALVRDDQVTDLTGLTGGEELEGYQQLYANRVAMVPRGPWAISEGVQSFGLEYGKDFTYVSMPFYGQQQKFANETGWSLSVNNSIDDKKKEAAFKFMDYFFQDDVILQHNISCTQIPAKKAVAQNSELLESMPYAEPLVKILENGQFIGYFNTDQFKEKVNTIFQQYVNGDISTAEEAMSKLTDECNSIIK